MAVTALRLYPPQHRGECVPPHQQPHQQRVDTAGDGELHAAGRQPGEEIGPFGCTTVHQRQSHALPEHGAAYRRRKYRQRRPPEGRPAPDIPAHQPRPQAVQNGRQAKDRVVAKGGKQAADKVGGKAHCRAGQRPEQQSGQENGHCLQRKSAYFAGNDGQQSGQHHAQRGQQGADRQGIGVEDRCGDDA